MYRIAQFRTRHLEELEARLTLSGNGFIALSGEAAAEFELPADVELVAQFPLDHYDLRYERYQQRLDGVEVLGAQTTVLRNDSGEIAAVIGSHYSDVNLIQTARLPSRYAIESVNNDTESNGHRTVDLFINPETGRYVFEVETQAADSRWIHWIDASSGQGLNRFNALAHNTCTSINAPCGYGVEGDLKSLADLTTRTGNSFQLISNDGRQQTHDQGSSRRPFLGAVAVDSDDVWTTEGRQSPGQGALVDAQYYANVTDDYLLEKHNFDWVQEAQKHNVNSMEIHAHFTKNYVNAFWNGSYLAFGDGDGVSFGPLTSLDVVAHELTHGVTEFTSDLIYQNESGALNESFSDIVGSSIEFYAHQKGLDPNYSPDWTVGEDFDLRSSGDGFRNMADPEEDGDPDHYSERYTGTSDNGGVHINSGIPNLAFVLLADGGFHPSCEFPGTHNSNHCTGGPGDSTPVAGIGLADAEQIFFLAMTSLSSNATMADARAATEAVASMSMFGGSQLQSTKDAWIAVGVGPISTGSPPDADAGGPYSGDEDASIAFDGSNSGDSDGDSLTYAWDFGDGNNATGETANHTYEYGGIFNVTLTVNDGNGGSDTSTAVVTVGEVNDIPVADAGGPYAGIPGVAITLDASASSDFDLLDATTANDQILTYHWDFGDGNTTTTNSSTINHTYANVDTYTVTLTVDDPVTLVEESLPIPAQTTVEISKASLVETAVDEALIDGTLRSGDYKATWASDNIYERITEEAYAGRKRSRLAHQWLFNVAPESSYTVSVEAKKDGFDDFIFQFSNDGGASWTNLFTVRATSDQQYSFPVTTGASGSALVRVRDTDRSRNEGSLDSIYVDEIFLSLN